MQRTYMKQFSPNPTTQFYLLHAPSTKETVPYSRVL